jgi:multidrug efflux pump subunit AcrA (membrane-fusion protein)
MTQTLKRPAPAAPPREPREPRAAAAPSPAHQRRRLVGPLALLISSLVVLLMFAGVGIWWVTRAAGPQTAGLVHRISTITLDVSITRDGELQAVENLDVVCPVEDENTIQWIVKEGERVNKGDVIVILESSDRQRSLESALLDLQRSQAELTAAKEQTEIQISTNAANLETSQAELTIAQLDLQQYVEGTYPQMLGENQRNVEMAEISVKTKEQELAQKQALFGKGFVNAAEVKNAQIVLLTAQNELTRMRTNLTVLGKYTHEKDLTEKRNKLQQSEKKLDRVQRESASNLAQRQADLQAKERTLLLRQEQYDKASKQLEACTIKAPGSGLVVYGNGSSQPWHRREQPIQAGARVRYQEQICRLPETSRMKAVARINETQVTRLHVDPANPIRASVKIVGVPEPVPGWLSTISVMADSSNRWWNPDAREYPVDITLDYTPPGLKPGMSCEITLHVDRIADALAVPLAAIYTSGKESYVFACHGDERMPMKVSIGAINETHAQLLDGPSPGTDVLLLEPGQGRTLLEKAGIKVDATAAVGTPQEPPARPDATTQPSPATAPTVAAAPTTLPVADVVAPTTVPSLATTLPTTVPMTSAAE